MSDVPMGADWYQATDGKWYPRQPPPPAAQQPPAPFQPTGRPLPGPAPQGPPSKKSRSGVVVGVCACVALAVLVLIAGALAGPSKQENVATKATDGSTTTEVRNATPPTTEAAAALPAADAPTTEAPTTEAPTTTATPTTLDPYANETVSQKNARRSAADYLDLTAFSRTGLIKQLEYEGFSQGDAAYAVDAMNADWNAQAAKSAAQYLDLTSFSRSGLVDQLVYEGFTAAEAEYGVGTTGL